ncbi:MAG: metal-dependent transcriptional regulator [Bacilli bacterium]
MKNQESREMYLETILILKNELDCVRAVDVSNAMSVTRASTSRALKLLRENSYICIDGLGGIVLTKQGKELATMIYDRHVTLTRFFEKIGVGSENAIKDACKIEHIISEESFNKIKEFLSK